MNGIAISLYDKFEDLEILVDIIRENWKEDYFISVCSNHPQAAKHIQHIDIDNFVQGAKINYSPDMSGHRSSINLNCRILDSIRRACKGAMEAGCDYIMHVHADAWILDETTIDRLISELQAQNKRLALRGYDTTYRRPGLWLGYPMDQFFLFEADYFRRTNFFDFELMDLFPHSSVHTMWAILLYGKLGRSNIYHYSDFTGDKFWDGAPITRPFGSPRSGLINEEYGLLHIPFEEFPDEYGREIQSAFLRKYNLTEGDKIKEFIIEHNMSMQDIKSDLHEIEKQQNKKLRRMGYRPRTLGREFAKKQAIIDKSIGEKMKILASNLFSETYHTTMRFLYAFSPFENNRFRKGLQTRYLYRDAEWPYQTHSDILSSTKKEDFPDDLTKFWFEGDKSKEEDSSN